MKVPQTELYKQLEPFKIHGKTSEDRDEIQSLIASVGGKWVSGETYVGNVYDYFFWGYKFRGESDYKLRITHYTSLNPEDPRDELREITLPQLRREIRNLISANLELEDLKRDGFWVKINGHGPREQQMLFDLGFYLGWFYNQDEVRIENQKEIYTNGKDHIWHSPVRNPNTNKIFFSNRGVIANLTQLRRRDLNRICAEEMAKREQVAATFASDNDTVKYIYENRRRIKALEARIPEAPIATEHQLDRAFDTLSARIPEAEKKESGLEPHWWIDMRKRENLVPLVVASCKALGYKINGAKKIVNRR